MSMNELLYYAAILCFAGSIWFGKREHGWLNRK